MFDTSVWNFRDTTARYFLLYTMAHMVEGSSKTDQPIKKGDTIKFVGDAADPFPKLQRQCATAKGSLTKALTAVEKSSLGFGNLTQEDELLTSQR